jgi:APA family basic amino acid/polyamine antiporter
VTDAGKPHGAANGGNAGEPADSAPRAAGTAVDEPSEGGYLRVLSLFDATLLVVGCIIGGGVFFNPQGVARETGDASGALIAWILGGGVALLGALSYAELGAAYPRAGGVYVFLREAYGRLPAFLCGWSVLFIIAPGALALVADFFAENLRTFVPGLGDSAKRWVATGVIALLTLVNIRGVKLGSRVQNVFTLGKLAALGAVVAAGCVWNGAPLERLPGAESAPLPLASHGALGVLLALVPILFTYGGWQNATFVAAEIRDPRRNVPRSMLIGTGIVIAVYVSVNWAFLRVLSPSLLASERRFATAAAGAALGPTGASIVALGILLSTFGICSAMLLANPRLVQAISADGCFFNGLARLHPEWRTPARAIALLGAWAIALLWLGEAESLVDSVVFADWVFFGLCGLAVLVLRRKRPGVARPYLCPLYPWVPLAFTLCAGVAVWAALSKAVESGALLRGLGLLALGVPVWTVFEYRRRHGAGAVRSG